MKNKKIDKLLNELAKELNIKFFLAKNLWINFDKLVEDIKKEDKKS